MRTLTIALSTIAAAALSAALLAQGKTDPALDKLSKELVAAVNARDAAKVASFYADDAVLMPPDGNMVRSRENIEAHYRGEFERITTTIQIRPIESITSGTIGFEAGTATVTMKKGTSPAATPDVVGGTLTGKYLAVLKRVGGDWKIAYDIYNVDPPLKPEKK